MITKEELMEKVERIDYWQPKGTTTTVCCLIFKNGFTTLGQSACADWAEFDAEKGKQYAFENAVENSFRFLAWDRAQKRKESC